MLKTALTSLIVAILLFSIFVIYVIRKGKDYDFAQIKVNGHTVNVEIANNPTNRAKGLMYKKEMGAEEGMFFIFPMEAKHRFWMANTYIPLDIIWINSNKEIVYIEENVPSCDKTGKMQALCATYKPTENAKYVLEVNAGWTVEKGVVVGDSIELIEQHP